MAHPLRTEGSQFLPEPLVRQVLDAKRAAQSAGNTNETLAYQFSQNYKEDLQDAMTVQDPGMPTAKRRVEELGQVPEQARLAGQRGGFDPLQVARAIGLLA